MGSNDMAFRVVILGGTSDGRQLAERLVLDPRYAVVLSFAGRTRSLQLPQVPCRVGGFGGVQGLVQYLRREGCQALVDATHPFAAQMSLHAVRAVEQTGTPLLRVECPAWRRAAGDRWQDVPDMEHAVQALGSVPRRVFSSVGRLEVEAFRAAPQHHYLIRAVDEFSIDLPHARVLAARGPFDVAGERELFERERVDVIVSKNAGTAATYAKIEAARALGLPVVLVARPALPPAPTVASWQSALGWLARLHELESSRRGV
ncbi:MAG TPA: cobalt-precorrin-6A reductase [Polyangiaceae bacterium]|nr:cobalt-precorrin-6A reductase [Polyangiaceae bacterium]